MHHFVSTGNRVMAFDSCQHSFLLNIMRTDGSILTKFCMCFDNDKI